ncbi:MAG: hypothetical protein MUF45_15135, partial [Spirosomaceae bacterium]|nr:hypothetical protein [Spirosomataceae bacterium]
MDSKSEIICIGLPSWEGDYLKSTVQLMSEMTEFRKVLYVEYTYTWIDVVRGFLGKNKTPYKRILGLEERLRTIKLENGNEVLVLTLPPILPINWIFKKNIYKYLLRFNAKIIERRINRVIQKVKFKNPVIINAFQPSFGIFLKGKFNENATIYYCYDEISEAQWCKNHGGWTEQEFMKMVDAVVVSSKALLDKKSKVSAKTYLVKNGVDTSIFSNPKSNLTRKTTIGYVGTIDDRIDEKLMSKLIESMPEMRFLFVGRVIDKSIELNLKKFPNVEFTGAKQPNELAEEMKRIDVGLIPFKKNEFTKSIYPLKINEYL